MTYIDIPHTTVAVGGKTPTETLWLVIFGGFEKLLEMLFPTS